jgi:hypothetical protein
MSLASALMPPLSQWWQSAQHECVTSKDTQTGQPFVRFQSDLVPNRIDSLVFIRD